MLPTVAATLKLDEADLVRLKSIYNDHMLTGLISLQAEILYPHICGRTCTLFLAQRINSCEGLRGHQAAIDHCIELIE